ncbi:phosphotransferase [uncultured Flavonifractor sp.]|uniref:phosphotransferase n=1 Tax=uncultured Flavonifractor sp. TaxID=1193534 RepID=UPI00261BF69B|nr:phosphotransferase [uncultured Flavonifractor sp.]
MNSYNLGGHSGCKILLIEDDDGYVYVRKISKNIEYNVRLKIQSEKQASFAGDLIKAPKVLNSGYTTDGLFFFDMEYIQGITLAEYIKTIEIGKTKGLVETLISGLVPKKIPHMTEAEKIKVTKIFSTKLSVLRKTLENLHNPIVEQALDLLEAHDWSSLTPTQCHGDMTLENIIIKNDSMYFIDFLDSFYDSWFLDIGTLLQDVQTMWSYRFEKSVNMNTVLRLIVFRDLLLDGVQKIHSEYIIEIYYALLQKLLRIYPYTKDERTYSFLNEKMQIVLDKIKRLE